MFTGLVEEVGIIDNSTNIGGGKKLKVKADIVLQNTKIDESIAINGCCQTVVSINKDYFEVVAIEETLRKTTLASYKRGDKVNLERAIAVGDRLGGHYVQGHIDTIGIVLKILKESSDWLISIKFPIEFRKYIVNVGSICINGVSLTVAKVDADIFTVAIIPHTFANTTIGKLKNGDKVNLEFDILGKYVENMLRYK